MFYYSFNHIIKNFLFLKNWKKLKKWKFKNEKILYLKNICFITIKINKNELLEYLNL